MVKLFLISELSGLFGGLLGGTINAKALFVSLDYQLWNQVFPLRSAASLRARLH